MLVTLLGMIALVSWLPVKALFPIPVTLYPSTFDGITNLAGQVATHPSKKAAGTTIEQAQAIP